MTKEEFTKRFQGNPHDYVVGVDTDLQKTLVDKNTGEHWALTQKDFDDIQILFEKLSQE